MGEGGCKDGRDMAGTTLTIANSADGMRIGDRTARAPSTKGRPKKPAPAPATTRRGFLIAQRRAAFRSMANCVYN